MHRLHTILILLFCLFPGLTNAAAFTGDMEKLGEGQAYYLKLIKVYDASLYSNGLANERNILSREVSKCLHLEYRVNIGRKDFIEAAETVLNRQFSDDQLARVKGDIETLHKGYRDVEGGDSYTLCYDSANNATTLSYNGGVLVSLDSPDFAEMYFSIWLGNINPLDETLRDDLLAGLLNN